MTRPKFPTWAPSTLVETYFDIDSNLEAWAASYRERDEEPGPFLKNKLDRKNILYSLLTKNYMDKAWEIIQEGKISLGVPISYGPIVIWNLICKEHESYCLQLEFDKRTVEARSQNLIDLSEELKRIADKIYKDPVARSLSENFLSFYIDEIRGENSDDCEMRDMSYARNNFYRVPKEEPPRPGDTKIDHPKFSLTHLIDRFSDLLNQQKNLHAVAIAQPKKESKGVFAHVERKLVELLLAKNPDGTENLNAVVNRITSAVKGKNEWSKVKISAYR